MKTKRSLRDLTSIGQACIPGILCTIISLFYGLAIMDNNTLASTLVRASVSFTASATTAWLIIRARQILRIQKVLKEDRDPIEDCKRIVEVFPLSYTRGGRSKLHTKLVRSLGKLERELLVDWGTEKKEQFEMTKKLLFWLAYEELARTARKVYFGIPLTRVCTREEVRNLIIYSLTKVFGDCQYSTVFDRRLMSFRHKLAKHIDILREYADDEAMREYEKLAKECLAAHMRPLLDQRFKGYGERAEKKIMNKEMHTFFFQLKKDCEKWGYDDLAFTCELECHYIKNSMIAAAKKQEEKIAIFKELADYSKN